MAERSAPKCKCQQKQAEAMKKSHQLGLDELMIVNPGQPGGEAFFLGEDGTLYQVHGLGEGDEPQRLGQFFLGEDGGLYQVQGFGAASAAERGEGSGQGFGKDDSSEPGRYFLGDDGTLYKVVGR
jgi:hypothetical protein